MIIDGIMLLWFALAAIAVAFVAIDIRNTPEHPVMKWAFVLFTAYAGVFGAFLYVLGCREPLPGLHEQYVSARWRQTLGSTMHCVAGDGVGILAGAVIAAVIALSLPAEVVLEYLLGFAFGWTIFQALFMRGMAGSYSKSLAKAFLPELLSMNCLMGGMIPTAMLLFADMPAARDPAEPLFWFRMSIALMVGFIIAYPMNWWLVAHHLKHGMMTVRPPGTHEDATTMPKMAMGAMHMAPVVKPGEIATATLVSFAVLAAGILIAVAFGGELHH